MVIEASSSLVDEVTVLAFVSKTFNMLLHVVLHRVFAMRSFLTIKTFPDNSIVAINILP